MKIKVILILLSLLLIGCGEKNYKEVEVINGFNRSGGYKIICIDGVEYVKIYRGLSGHFKPDGSLHTCENE